MRKDCQSFKMLSLLGKRERSVKTLWKRSCLNWELPGSKLVFSSRYQIKKNMTTAVNHCTGRTMLRMMVISLAIMAISSEQTTMQTPSINSVTEGSRFQATSSKRSGMISTPSQETSNLIRKVMEEASTTPSQNYRKWHFQSDETQTIQEFVSELMTVSLNPISTEMFGPMDTSKWQWEFSWDWNIIIQFILSLLGVFGNLLVVIIMGVRKSTSNSTDILVMALAVADLLTSVCNIPIPQATQVPASILGALYCRILLYKFHTWVCVITSSLILVGLSFERFAAVRCPLHFRKIFTNRRVYFFITVTWLFSFLSCCYYFIDIQKMLQESFSIENSCVASASVPSRLKALKVFTMTNFVIRLVIPTILMTVTQTATAVTLHLQSRRLRGSLSTSQTPSQTYHILARNRVIKVMLIVVIIFILSWAPSQITWVIVSFRGSVKDYIDSTQRQILNLITFINSCINPFIYTSQYPKFRSALKEILVGKTKKNVPLFGINFPPLPIHTHDKQ